MDLLYKGLVTHVTDPSNFWMRIGAESCLQLFDEYQDKVDAYYNEHGRKNNVAVHSLSQGDTVMVADTGGQELTMACDGDENTNFHWRRAQVARVQGDTVDVFYIDHGYTEIVNVLQVKSIHQQLFDYMPPQVIRLGLAGIRPLTHNWTTRTNTFFKDNVLGKDLVVYLVEFDEAHAHGKVWLYLKVEDGRWHSLTHEMLDEELGLPTGDVRDEWLSEDTVLAALASLEEMQKQHHESEQEEVEEDWDGRGQEDGTDQTCPIDTQQDGNGNNSAAVSGFGAEEHDDSGQDSAGHDDGGGDGGGNRVEEYLEQHFPHLHLPAPTDFMMPSQTADNHSEISTPPVGVPGFDLNSLMQTRSLSLTQMQREKETETRRQRKAALEQDLLDCEGDEDAEDHEVEWGKSDLHLGHGNVFDVHDDIAREIHSACPRRSSQDDLAEFFYAKRTGQAESQSYTLSENTESQESARRKTVKFKPLTEMEDYEIQKRVEEILQNSDNEEPELLFVLINSVIEPSFDVPCDRLTSIFTAILESMTRDSSIDPTIALGALGTYSDAAAFKEAILNVLKTLKDRFVKLAQCIRSPGHHRSFAKVLAMVFIHAESWPRDVCKEVQEFANASVERWTVFNKQRKQDRDTAVNVEHMYLECVETFIDNTQDLLAESFHKHYQQLLEDMRQKLLHDSTSRSVRVQLLDMLLKFHTGRVPWLAEGSSKGVNVATQTGRYDGQESDRQYGAGRGRVNSGNQQTAATAGFYRPPRGMLYPRGDPFTPYSFPGDGDYLSEHSPKETDEPNTVSISEMYSKLGADVTSLEPTNDAASLSAASSAANLPSTSPEANPLLTSPTVKLPLTSQTCDTLVRDQKPKGSPKKGFPKTLLKLPPRLQKKFLQERNLPDEYLEKLRKEDGDDEFSDTQDKAVSSLNVDAPEFTPISPTWQMDDQETRQTDNQRTRQVDDRTQNIRETCLPPHSNDRDGASYKVRPPPGFLDDQRTRQTDDQTQNLGETCRLPLSNDIDGTSCKVRPPPGFFFSSPQNKMLNTYGLRGQALSHETSSSLNVEEEKGDFSLESIPASGEALADDGVDQSVVVGLDQYDVSSDTELCSQTQEVSSLDSENAEAVEDVEPEMRKNQIIKYTTEELKVLDPCYLKPHLRWSSITHPAELSFMFDSFKTSPGKISHRSAEPKKDIPSAPIHRYTGQGGSPLEMSTAPNSIYGKWKSLSELLPPSNLERTKPSSFSSSVDPESFGPRGDKYHNSGDRKTSENPSAQKSTLKDLAGHLLGTNESQSPVNMPGNIENTNADSNTNNTANDLEMRNDIVEKNDPHGNPGETAATVEAKEVNHKAGVLEWPERFFRSIKPVTKGENRGDENISAKSESESTRSKKGKKKLKFRPLNEVLSEHQPVHGVDEDLEEHRPARRGMDEFAFDVDDDDNSDFDEFSPEAIKMYEELDRQEQEREQEAMEGRIIHPSRLGALSGGTKSKRTSLFADVRQQHTGSKAELWVPGKRKCTRCGSDEHIIYDCPQPNDFHMVDSWLL